MIMRIVLFSFTDRGARLAEKLGVGFNGMGHQASVNDRSGGGRTSGSTFSGEPAKEPSGRLTASQMFP